MYEGLKIANMYTLSETIAEELLSSVTYPWEVLPKIGEFIKKLGPTLSEEEYEYRGDDVWVAKDAVVFPSAYIHGPAIIGKGAEVRHCAFIRGNAIVGEGAVVGNSTELKNVILFNKVQVPHYNYVGDSILGFKAHMGAGSITSNVKSDKKLVVVHTGEGNIETGLKMQQCFKSRHSAWTECQCLSNIICSWLCAGCSYIQSAGSNCKERGIACKGGSQRPI